MIYQYECDKCQTFFDVVKSMKDAAAPECCPDCGNDADRVYLPPHITGAKVEDAEFNHGLGCVTKNKYDRAEIAKRKGLIEVGNECPDAMGNKAEKDLRERLDRSWDEV